MKSETDWKSGEPAEGRVNRMVKLATMLGREVVDIAGALDQLDADGKVQVATLEDLAENSAHVAQINAAAVESLATLARSVDTAMESLSQTVTGMEEARGAATHMAEVSAELRARSTSIQPVLDAVQANNEQILAIAAQVNMLAINAKIEAARAGEAGRGFSVVADAINELSARTGAAAQDVTQNVAGLTDELRMINDNALRLGDIISDVTRIGGESHRTLNIASRDFREAGQQARQVEQDSRAAQDKLAMFRPTVDRLDGLVRGGTDALTRASHRVTRLIDGSERLVQDSVALGGASRESRFIEEVQRLAAAISTAFEAGVDSGRISLRDLFDTDLRPVRGTDPQQFTTRFTRFTDQVLPPIQEPALDFDSRVVFCASVDRKGYLPTHNRKFSCQPGKDPVWNAAHCRNRRVFDDRVGLKAGTSTEPFLLQVYRRDMGGGKFVIMIDASAPITVKGRHWGGLRLAFRF